MTHDKSPRGEAEASESGDRLQLFTLRVGAIRVGQGRSGGGRMGAVCGSSFAECFGEHVVCDGLASRSNLIQADPGRKGPVYGGLQLLTVVYSRFGTAKLVGSNQIQLNPSWKGWLESEGFRRLRGSWGDRGQTPSEWGCTFRGAIFGGSQGIQANQGRSRLSGNVCDRLRLLTLVCDCLTSQSDRIQVNPSCKELSEINGSRAPRGRSRLIQVDRDCFLMGELLGEGGLNFRRKLATWAAIQAGREPFTVVCSCWRLFAMVFEEGIWLQAIQLDQGRSRLAGALWTAAESEFRAPGEGRGAVCGSSFAERFGGQAFAIVGRGLQSFGQPIRLNPSGSEFVVG